MLQSHVEEALIRSRYPYKNVFINNIMQQQLAQADVSGPCQSRGKEGTASPLLPHSLWWQQCPVKSIPLGLLVPRRPVGRAVPDGEQVIVARNVTVPGQVIGVLKVAGTPTAAVLDYADSGLNFVDVFIGC